MPIVFHFSKYKAISRTKSATNVYTYLLNYITTTYYYTSRSEQKKNKQT